MKDLLAPLVPYWTTIKWGARVGFWLALVGFGWWGGSRSGAIEVADLKLAHAKAATKAEQALAKATNDARRREHELGDQFIAATARHYEELRRAQAANDQLRADLRSGAVRLHERWTCGPATAASRPGADAGADDRAASASRAIAAAAECDAQVRGLQAIVKAERAK